MVKLNLKAIDERVAPLAGREVYDREFKRDAYLALGVREVWLVDVMNRSIGVYVQPGGGRVVQDVIEWIAPDSSVSVPVELEVLFANLV